MSSSTVVNTAATGTQQEGDTKLMTTNRVFKKYDDLQGWMEELGMGEDDAKTASIMLLDNNCNETDVFADDSFMTKDRLKQFGFEDLLASKFWAKLARWRQQAPTFKRQAEDELYGPRLKKLRELENYEISAGKSTEICVDSTVMLNPQELKTVYYFARDGMPKLFDDITGDQKGQKHYNIAVIGSPGSGKSNIVYAAAESLAYKRKTPVLWLGRRLRNKRWQVRFFWPSAGEKSACLEELENKSKDIEEILRLEKAQQVEVLILDAPTRSDDESSYDGAAAFAWAGGDTGDTRKENRRVIHVSSLGAFAHSQNIRDDCRLREEYMRIWTREDFIHSLQENEQLKKQVCDSLSIGDRNTVSAEDVVDMKFFYSGINARWFFNNTIDQIKAECSEIVARLDARSSEAGMKSQQAINSLQATIIDGGRIIKVFTSCYLAHRVGTEGSYQKRFLSLFPLVRKYLGNGAPGEIFESDFAMHLQQSHDVAKAQVAAMKDRAQPSNVQLGIDENNKRIEWPTGELQMLPKANGDPIVPQSTGLKAVTAQNVPQWFIPEDNSQAFLDFMVLVPMGTKWQLRIVQNTVGGKHSADLEKLDRIVRGVLGDEFALDNHIILAYVIEDRDKGGSIANGLNDCQLKVQKEDASEQVFTLKVSHPVYTRTAMTPN